MKHSLRLLLLFMCGAAFLAASCNKKENPQPTPTPPDPPQPTDSYVHIKSEADLSHFLDTTGVNFTDTVVFDNDITVSGVLPCGADFGGVLDGRGHSIKAWNSKSALFASNSGKICNLKIDSGSKLTPDPGIFGAFVCENKGTLENLSCDGLIEVKADKVDVPLCVGGIAGCSEGPVKGCTGNSRMSVEISSTCSAVGMGGVVGYMKDSLVNCEFKGTVSLTIEKNLDKVIGFKDIEAVAPSLGAFVGYAVNGCQIQGCEGNGSVELKFSATTPSELPVIQVGGIVGSPFGTIADCISSSKVDVLAHSRVNVGGIGGGDFYFTGVGKNSHTSYIGCKSKGEINVDIQTPDDVSCIGGIVGWPGREASHTTSINNCDCESEMTVKGVAKVRVGGISGASGNVEGCTFSGSILIENADPASSVGGLKGYQFYTHKAKASISKCVLESKVPLAGMGGLFGMVAEQPATTGDGCKVESSISADDMFTKTTGMVAGSFSGIGKAITLGTVSSPIEVNGTIDYGDGPIPVTAGNLSGVLAGLSNVSSKHTINAKYSGSSKDGNFAEGYVKYDDGSPAKDVAVSDGFNVVHTDTKGYFKLEGVTADSWYIYISLPADAAVVKSKAGLPDFFCRYNSGRTQYDFTLKKQPVENEFSLFAMADPQAHNAIRAESGVISEKINDVQRVHDETVPAVNAQIAAQGVPSYGVVLGDIVYSSATRNSSVGMPQMRDNFSQMNMPVFCVMGNHDFAFFGSNAQPYTDATSSTLYLSAQRSFESNFGPVNYSFNRGDVHVVCMRDIVYHTGSYPEYHGELTTAQIEWLRKDLERVDRNKMIVFCAHIPVLTIEKEGAVALLRMMQEFKGNLVMTGHTHYPRPVLSTHGSDIFEQIHGAVCGTFWWGNIQSEGSPNGYTVYKFSGNKVKDSYFIGVNAPMNTRDYQMRIYRGDINVGGNFCRFQLPYERNTYLINVFNANPRWTVKVYENDVYAGTLSLLPMEHESFVTQRGQTYYPTDFSSQDWYAVGYMIGVCQRGTGSATNYYGANYHMYKYVASSADAKITVEATDPYGNTYTCSDIVENESDGKVVYPDYIRAPINVTY